MRQKLSEEADHFQYTYDKSKSLLEQVLHTVDNVHLINVRKTYTNNIYFGVYWTVLINDHQPFLAHNFQCKDRGYTEDVVDDWEKFKNVKPLEDILNFTPSIIKRKPIFKKQKIDLPLICGRKFDVVFVYNGVSGRYDYTHLQDNNGTFRGLYGSKSEQCYNDKVKEFGIAIPPDRDPYLNEIKYLWEQANISFSNSISFINTVYSNIKVDLKGRKNEKAKN